MFAALGLCRWGGFGGLPGIQKLGVLGVGASGSHKGFSVRRTFAHRVQCPISRPTALLTRRAKGPDVKARFPIQAPAEDGKLEFRVALGESVSAGIPELVLQQVLDTICGPG